MLTASGESWWRKYDRLGHPPGRASSAVKHFPGIISISIGCGPRSRGALRSAALVLCAQAVAAADPAGSPNPADLDAEMRELAAYRQALDDAIAERGPYSPELAETYQGFSHYLQQRGRHADALAMLRKARHLERVNHGIHSAAQIPVLHGMLASYRATGQVEATTDVHRELLRLAERGLAAGDPARITLLHDAARWHLAAHLIDADALRLAHLQAADELLERAWRLAETQAAATAIRAALLRDRALLHFHVLRDRDNRSREPQAPAGYRLASEVPGTGVHTLTASIGGGRELLEARIALLERETPAATAELRRARLDLADWELLFDGAKPAVRSYRKLLAEGPDADALFAAPLPLPAARADGDPQLTARIRLDVSADGRPDHIELLDSAPFSDPEQRHRILRAVRETRFRPVFSGGEPVASAGAVIAFPLAD